MKNYLLFIRMMSNYYKHRWRYFYFITRNKCCIAVYSLNIIPKNEWLWTLILGILDWCNKTYGNKIRYIDFCYKMSHRRYHCRGSRNFNDNNYINSFRKDSEPKENYFTACYNFINIFWYLIMYIFILINAQNCT